MTAKQLTGYRTQLQGLADRVSRSLAHDQHELRREEDPDMPGGPIASTEDRVDSGSQEIEFGLIANEEKLLDETNAALMRIDSGSFGVCESCGKAIAQARLNALPYVRNCIHCARGA